MMSERGNSINTVLNNDACRLLTKVNGHGQEANKES
ncbi:hypothetical protein THOM_1142 [Trachipleistophora hominis]|uniref:Uncharacterized protein n=1 Tax=Trachipleistophora hominis TaxID=72359 RepID=L7JYR5_TRAHO|nr:hypothetical protein THOM_1142 [Trachipleistophora hominis]